MNTPLGKSLLTAAIFMGISFVAAPVADAAPAPVKGSILDQPEKLRITIPLEQLISTTRKKYGDLVVHSARLQEEDRHKVFIINFVDSKNQNHRVVYDAFTGKEVDNASLKTPMPLEKTLAKVRSKHPEATLIRSWLDRREGDLVRMLELADKKLKLKRLQLTVDAYTGRIVKEETYDLKPSGKQISLEQVLKNAREKYKGMVVLRTRSSMKHNNRIREIIFLDDNRVRHKMTVNAVTGEVIEDKITPLGFM